MRFQLHLFVIREPFSYALASISAGLIVCLRRHRKLGHPKSFKDLHEDLRITRSQAEGGIPKPLDSFWTSTVQGMIPQTHAQQYLPMKAGDEIRTRDVQLGKLAFYH